MNIVRQGGENAFVETSLVVRMAQSEDASDILRWRNDSHTRGMSRNSDLILEKDHQIWLEKTLRDPNFCLIVGLYSNVKFGIVRFNKDKLNEWEVGINIAPEARGKGLGKILLSAALSNFALKHSNVMLNAEVKLFNKVSQHLFESLGFSLASQVGDIRCYTKISVVS